MQSSTATRTPVRVAAAAWAVLLVLSGALPSYAQAPAYSRTRQGADDWRWRGGGWEGRGGWGYNNFYPSYFNSGPVVVGNWYQRPYPYHFDYYRHRWGAPPADYSPAPSAAAPDCPCAAPEAPVEMPIDPVAPTP